MMDKDLYAGALPEKPKEGGGTVVEERASVPNGNALVSRQFGKRHANRYLISVNRDYKDDVLKWFRGRGAAQYFRQSTSELWTPPFSELTCAQYGAFRRILMMMARHKDSLTSGNILTTKKELKSFGITCHLLDQLELKIDVLDIFLITDDGEINNLPWD